MIDPFEQLLLLDREIRDTELLMERSLTEAERDIASRHLTQLKEQRDEVHTRSPGRIMSEKLIWAGTKRELADWILKAWRAHFLEASSELNALERATEHIEMKDGSKLTGRNLQQNIKRRAEEGK